MLVEFAIYGNVTSQTGCKTEYNAMCVFRKAKESTEIN